LDFKLNWLSLYFKLLLDRLCSQIKTLSTKI
jgi:hypothetical protein